MTATRYALRQDEGRCQRTACPYDATDGQYCGPHAEAQRDYQRRCMAQRRELRRDNDLCAECGEPSATYRCATCQGKRRPSEDLRLLAR